MKKEKSTSAQEQEKSSFMHEMLRVLYAPHKAFKALAQTPKYIGPVLIAILFAATFAWSAQAYLSRAYVEQTVPKISNGDEWTQNSTLWMSNAIKMDSADHIGGGFYGNSSVEFSVANETSVWMELSGIGPVNCSGSQGYKNVSLRTKPIYPSETELLNASLYLFSSQTGYFYYNLTNDARTLNNTWINLTIPLGSGNGWADNGTDAEWASINGLKLGFTWSQNASLIVRVDGVFFRGFFKSPLENTAVAMFDYFTRGLMQYVIRWVLMAILIYIMTKGLGGSSVWRPTLILTGLVLMPMVIQGIVNIAAFSTLPTLRYPFEFIAPAEGEGQAIYNQVVETEWFVSQVVKAVQIMSYVWIVALSSIMVRVSTGVSWIKSLLIGTVALFTSLLIEGFILV